MAVEARDKANRLLRRLLADRQASEQRFAEAGKCDPIKYMTGISSLDRAIDSTRAMIEHIDDLLSELQIAVPTTSHGARHILNGIATAAATAARLQPAASR